MEYPGRASLLDSRLRQFRLIHRGAWRRDDTEQHLLVLVLLLVVGWKAAPTGRVLAEGAHEQGEREHEAQPPEGIPDHHSMRLSAHFV